MQLPTDFVQRISSVFDGGAAWLSDLPRLLALCEQRFDITLGQTLPLSYNFVTAALRSDGAPVVLKLGVPNPELFSEMDALERYAGNGAVTLVDCDRTLGALLLERLHPGDTLATLPNDDDATRIAAGLMVRLWRTVEAEHGFHTVARWGAALAEVRPFFDGGTGPLHPTLLAIAEACYAAADGEHTLLHGDLHHENILSAQREPWLVIDPKGIVGPRGYEVGAYLRNYLVDKPNPAQTNARRVEHFVELLGLSHEEVLRWGVAHNVLSAWWSIEEEGGGYEDALLCATLCGRALGHAL